MAEVSTGKIRVYLIDEHPIVREGFGRAFADTPDIVVVGQADTADAALKEAASTTPDVILVDLHTPDRDGIELIGALRARMPLVKLLVLGTHDDEIRVVQALRAGASGYLVKTARIEEVVESIRRAVVGGAMQSPRIAGAVVRAMRRAPLHREPPDSTAAMLDGLTPHQQQVLKLLLSWPSRRRR